MPERRPTNPIEAISEQVGAVLKYFESKELNGGKIQTSTFIQRLAELENSRQVPVVVFNCIFFNYSPDPESGYPLYTALDGTEKPISAFYLPRIVESLDALSTIGSPKPYIVVPDSELLDERIFPFTQNEQERQQIALKMTRALKEVITAQAPSSAIDVILWSQYCQKYGLKSPFDYTQEALLKVINQRPEAIQRQTQDSYQYFLNRGLDYKALNRVSDEEFENRIKWYLAMYAGEGRALEDSGAIVLNFEDLRVRKWLKAGSENQLPVLTPVPTLSDYKKWQSA